MKKRKEFLVRSKKERSKDFAYISVEKLKDGYLYKIHARNAEYGIWVAACGHFIISRIKYTTNYLFEEIHWDLSTHFGTVRPIEEIEKSPFDPKDMKERVLIKGEEREYLAYKDDDQILEYLNQWEEN